MKTTFRSWVLHLPGDLKSHQYAGQIAYVPIYKFGGFMVVRLVCVDTI